MTDFSSIRNAVAVADPESPTHVLKPNADGSVNVTATGSGVASNLAQIGGTTVKAGTSGAAGALGVIVAPNGALLTAVAVNIATGTTTQLVAAVAAQVVRIYRIFLVVSAADNLTFKTAAASLHGGALVYPANGGLVFDYSGEPWFVCGTNEALNLTTTTTAQVSGLVYYTQG